MMKVYSRLTFTKELNQVIFFNQYVKYDLLFLNLFIKVNDQLIYIYQQLLIKKQNLLAATNNPNVILFYLFE